jgi:hypothetical protein
MLLLQQNWNRCYALCDMRANCHSTHQTKKHSTFTWKACLTTRAWSEHVLWFLKHRHNFNIPFYRTLRCQAKIGAQWHGMQWRAGRFTLHRHCSLNRGLFNDVVSNLNYIIFSRYGVLCVAYKTGFGLDLLRLIHSYNSGLQVIQSRDYSTQFALHRYTRTRTLSLH